MHSPPTSNEKGVGISRAALILAIKLCLAACASSSSSPPESYARDRITQQDIAATLALNAYDAVRLLRRRWLGDRLMVFENGALVSQDAGIFLRSLRIESVREIRYLEHEVARTVYGYSIGGAVIEVDTVVR